ncbi:MAG: hypothetical protein KAG12_09740 [Desulfuromusa sp.]|nr:hypothetical protein [Desulfuromusa sp.]
MLLILLLSLLFFSLVNFYYSIQILRRVSAAEIKISFFEIRWQVHKHMKKYRQLTRAENGRTGLPWYGYWLSLTAMIVCGCWLFISIGTTVGR